LVDLQDYLYVLSRFIIAHCFFQSNSKARNAIIAPRFITFPQDKEAMLEKVAWMRQHPEVIRPKGLRGF